MGHEFSGVITAAGEHATKHHPRVIVGQRVTANPLWYCGRCPYCLAGRQNLCPQRQLLGAHQPGSYAEFVRVHAKMVYPLPDSLSLERAALTEPLACAMRAARLAACTPMDQVLILGLGPIGLLTLQVVQAFGVTRLYAVDMDPDRRAMAGSFGVQVLDPTAAGRDVVSWIKTETGGLGVDVAIDAVGAGATRRQCIEAVAPGGRVVFVGLHEEESALPANLLIRKELSLQGDFAYTPADFEHALDRLTAGRAHMDSWLVTAPLAEGGAWFERLLAGPGPVAKVLLASKLE
jgi:threonine dehydrogenase-like Zn-dependent dehydrogenase